MKLIAWQPGGDGTLYHWCPGCNGLHPIPPNRWTRTGTDDLPTYRPSFLQYGRKDRGNCHYFISAGYLDFQADSWHNLRGMVPMPDIPFEVVEHLTDAIFDGP